MVALYLASFLEAHESRTIEGWRRLAALDTHRKHQLTDDPVDADVVLFVDCHVDADGNDWRLRAILEHPLSRHFADRVFVYNERDHPFCALPGVYVSMPARHFDRRFQRAGTYWNVTDPADLVDSQPDDGERYLFSFVGSMSHRSRRELMALEHPKALLRSVDDFLFFDKTTTTYDQRRREFADAVVRSSFVLCPRGQGTASIRLFEVMAAGRVPVIISNDWVPPEGVDWPSFSVRWPEHDLKALPGYLEGLSDEAEPMGRRAKDTFEEHFGKTSWWHTTGELLEDLVAQLDRRLFTAQHFERGVYMAQLQAVHAQAAARTLAGRNVRRVKKAISPRWSYLDPVHRTDRAALVVSSGRSGSTWLTEVLNWDNAWRVIFEPFDDRIIASHAGVAYRYLEPDAAAPEVHRAVDAVLAGRLRNWWADSQNRRRLAIRRLVKEIRITNLLPWLSVHFSEVPIIYLLRHPLAVAESMRELDPDHGERLIKWWRIDRFEENPELMEGPLSPFSDLIAHTAKSGDWMARFVLRWCIENYVPVTEAWRHRAFIIFYEDLVMEPERHLRQLAAHVGRPFDARMLEVVERPSAHANPRRERPDDALDRLCTWSATLSPTHVDDLLGLIGAFGLRFLYGREVRPKLRAEELRAQGSSGAATGG